MHFHLWQVDLHIDHQASVTATLENIQCITRRYFSCQDQFLCDRIRLWRKRKQQRSVEPWEQTWGLLCLSLELNINLE